MRAVIVDYNSFIMLYDYTHKHTQCFLMHYINSHKTLYIILYFIFYMFIVMHHCTRANCLYVKTYLAINLILILRCGIMSYKFKCLMDALD